jgi:hypothetical protein
MDPTISTSPLVWGMAGTLALLVLVVAANLDPELTEVYAGNAAVTVTSVVLATAVLVLLLAGGRPVAGIAVSPANAPAGLEPPWCGSAPAAVRADP